jgi:hypothetical protein
MVGKIFPKQNLEKVMHETKVPHIIDENNYKIYLPSDFIHNNGSTSAHWRELGYLVRHSNSSASATGGFDMFLSSLLDHLTKKGFFTIGGEPCQGDYLVNDRGIIVNLSEAYERMGISPNSEIARYFPRKEEDAVSIAKFFFSGPTFVTQVLSVQNVDWDISRKYHEEDKHGYYKGMLEDQKKLRAAFLKKIGYKDQKFVDAEY